MAFHRIITLPFVGTSQAFQRLFTGLEFFPLQAHVQPSRRQSGLATRELNKADLNLVDLNRRAELSQPASLEGSRNPLEGGRRALVELNSEEVNRRAGSGFNQFQLDALAEHNVCR